MSSITTSLPSGSLANGPTWCIQNMIDIFGTDSYPFTYNECANETKGMKKEDFQTICCDGDIIDTSTNLWSMERRNMSSYELDIDSLVCCREGGQLLPGGIMPIDTDWKHCDMGQVATPLASLAATNTKNAALYLVTYESAQEDSTGGLRDWTVTESPTCLWVETKYTGITMVDLEVPAAEITTLPRPSTDRLGNTIMTSWGAETTSTSTDSPSRSGDAAAGDATGRAESLSKVNAVMVAACMGLCLGLVTVGVL